MNKRQKAQQASTRLRFFVFPGPMPENEKCLLGVSQTLIETEAANGEPKEKYLDEVLCDGGRKVPD